MTDTNYTPEEIREAEAVLAEAREKISFYTLFFEPFPQDELNKVKTPGEAYKVFILPNMTPEEVLALKKWIEEHPEALKGEGDIHDIYPPEYLKAHKYI